ncbi:MAG: UvrD-helicase domain-containing protein [Deltaproteobacteria bacterium]
MKQVKILISLEGLNEKQVEAVTCTEGPLLVLAGAGSGKTRVLTNRIAHLILEKSVASWSILALTFTNKAAKEMKERVCKLVGQAGEDMWISTFHSMCVRMLRRDIEKLGFGSNFVIFDSGDQQTLIKECLKELNLNDKNFPPRSVLEQISKAKDQMIGPSDYSNMYASDFRLGKIALIYELYQKKLRQNNALDFDDLIFYTIQLLMDNQDVLEYYQKKFKYILVDEYQDTNSSQFTLISLMSARHGNICVVGDDDQCLPEGTLINTPNGSIPIEKIVEGQSITCAGGWGELMIGKVDKSLKKKYEGIIIRIKTKTGKEISATPNHIGFAKIHPHSGVYYVYLMYKKGVGYRIGQTQGVRSRKNEIVNGLNVRLNQEHGDKMWILNICLSKEEASYYEQMYSFKYGIPTTLFHGNGRSITLSQKYINKIYEEIDTISNAMKLMGDLIIFEEYPHHVCNAVVRGQSVRQIINITAFGGRKTAADAGWHSHRICLNTSGEQLKNCVKEQEFPVRDGNRNTWRVETERKEYDEADFYAKRMAQIDENLEIIKKAKLTENTSFMYMPFAHIKPTMSVAVMNNGKIEEDIVEEVKYENYEGNVYDLSLPHFRQYVSEGIVVHNSIYGWRGADIRNILDFEKEFPGTKVVKLEQNYRSTGNILDAANHVIKNNAGRKSKKLWTEKGKGDNLRYYCASNEYEEADYIAYEINKLMRNLGKKYSDFAVLYRMNAQSRAIEEGFMRYGIPYRIVGAQKFYDRKEIKDLIAYLRLIHNPMDSLSLKRIINVPKRGIGKATIEFLESHSAEKNVSIFSLIQSAKEITGLSRNAAALEDFAAMISSFRASSETVRLPDFIEELLNKTGYIRELEQDGTAESLGRIENLKEFISVAIDFDKFNEDAGLGAFLESIALVADVDDSEEQKDEVILMTLHSAKGLEFPVVFLSGMEEGVFPGYKANNEECEMEEERRLCYVGITRAREVLYLTGAYCRTIYGSTSYNRVSRFITELPEELVEGLENIKKKEEKLKSWDDSTDDSYGYSGYRKTTKTFAETASSHSSGFKSVIATVDEDVDFTAFRVGAKVEHRKFGSGVITKVDPEGNDLKLDIAFREAGNKRLMARYAGLKITQ